MTEEIMSRLSEIGALQVVSRTSARRFRGTSLSMREVGSELSADYVLEGTVRTDRGGSGGGTARVAARLIRAADDVRVWQQTFDAALVPGEILIVQAGIATQVAAALNVSLGTGEEGRVTRVTTQDSAAYRLYQLGRFQWEKRDAASLQQAINHFRDAVTRDPAFADAHAGLSDAIGATVLLYGDSHSASYDENRRLALAAARRAVALDSALAAAHASLGFGLFFFEWDFVAAEQSFTHAIRMDPEYGPARYWYTQLLWVLGRFDEALAQSQAAVAADPLSAVAFLARARSFRLIGREAEWVADLRRTTELQSALPVPWFDLAEYHAARGSVDSARVASRRFLELRFGPGVQDETVVALVDALAGSGSLENVVRAHLRDGTPEADGLLARLYALRGQHDSAFARLQRLETSRSVELMLTLPFVEPLLAEDPRWAELRARLRI
jgi:serine/threonine-protein kinase